MSLDFTSIVAKVSTATDSTIKELEKVGSAFGHWFNSHITVYLAPVADKIDTGIRTMFESMGKAHPALNSELFRAAFWITGIAVTVGLIALTVFAITKICQNHCAKAPGPQENENPPEGNRTPEIQQPPGSQSPHTGNTPLGSDIE